MMTTSACFWGKILPLCHENKIQCDLMQRIFSIKRKNGVKVATFCKHKNLESTLKAIFR